MEPMCNPHTIGSSMLESLRPQLAKGSAFKNAEAPSEDTAMSLAFSVSVELNEFTFSFPYTDLH